MAKRWQAGDYIRVLPTALAHKSYFGRVYRIHSIDRDGSLNVASGPDPTIVTIYFYAREVEPATEEEYLIDRLTR